MKINYELNEDFTFKSYTSYPIDEKLPYIDDTSENISKIKLNNSKLIDGVIIHANPILERINQNTTSFRGYRRICFNAFDIYKGNVLYGLIDEKEAQKTSILSWYREMCDFPIFITETTTKNDYPLIPTEIERFIL